MGEKTCCVTGHRDIPKNQVDYIKNELQREVLSAIDDGYTRFLSGFADGIDLMFAAIVAKEKTRHPELILEAAIPYARRLKNQDRQFQLLLGACNSIRVECETYTPSCYMQRNRYMVDQSQRVIAVYDGRDHGGTLFTMRYARTHGREIRQIKI